MQHDNVGRVRALAFAVVGRRSHLGDDGGFGTQLGRNHTRTARTFAGAAFPCARRRLVGRRRRLCRNNAVRQARGHGPRGDCSQCRTSLQPSLKKATAGPACRRPGRPTRGRLGPAYYSLDVPENTLLTRRSRKYATHSSAPTTRDLVNGSRTSFLASRRRSARPRRHAGGRRPASAARRASWGFVILEVRRVLELLLGPAHLQLDYGGVVIAAGHGGIATSAGAAAGVGGNGLERAHIDGDALFPDAEESAYAHDQPEDLAVLVEQHVTHVADVCVVGAKDIGAFEFGENPVVRALRRDEFRGVMRGGIGFRRR